MCGGQLEKVPCSHVGHIFRNKWPYAFDMHKLYENSARLAEVWMDDYKEYYYKRIGMKPVSPENSVYNTNNIIVNSDRNKNHRKLIIIVLIGGNTVLLLWYSGQFVYVCCICV